MLSHIVWPSSKRQRTYFLTSWVVLFSKITGTADWEVVRPTAGRDQLLPVYDVTSEAIRCHQQNPGGGGNTSTLTVRAGQTITFLSSPWIRHPGPLSAYMAKAPAGISAATFDGSGLVWFKVYQELPTYSDKLDPVYRGWTRWSSNCTCLIIKPLLWMCLNDHCIQTRKRLTSLFQPVLKMVTTSSASSIWPYTKPSRLEGLSFISNAHS